MNEVSEKFIEYGLKNSSKCIIENPDGYAEVKGECGDTVTFFLTINDGIISAINYDIDGCINSNACTNALIALSEGKTIKEVLKITPFDIEKFLETLPKNEFHCAEMVVDAMSEAVKDYFLKSENSWKRQYR